MNKLWTDEEIQLLTEKYENGMYVKDIQKQYFPHYTVSQVSSKASVLGLKHKTSCVWSKEMDELLIKTFPYYSNKELHELYFNNQTPRAIEARARKLNLFKEKIIWTEEEDNILKKYYNNIKLEDLIEMLNNKTKNAILNRTTELNLKNEYIQWTQDEIDILLKYYKSIGAKGIYELFIKRHTVKNIIEKANAIGLTRRNKPREWTDEEIYLLKKLYNTYSVDYLIENYFQDRTRCQIEKKKKELNLVVTTKFKNGKSFWTKEKVDLLYNIYPYMNTEDFYNQYFCEDISMSAMYGKIVKLGIKKDETFATGWTEEQINIVKELYPNKDILISDIAKKCDKTISQVQWYANSTLGLYRKTELFSSEERELIKELYPHNRTSDIIHLFEGRTVPQLERYAVRMGVHKTKDYIRWVTLEGTKHSLGVTKPQQIINELLEQLKINYISEYDAKYYLIDSYLKDYNLMIEVQGDYWHCSPLLANKKCNTSGVKGNIKKDKAKHTYVKNKYGINILYLWETDINENLELCKNLILEYIKNNGKLENYHSFNYELLDNKLVLKEDKYVIGY